MPNFVRTTASGYLIAVFATALIAAVLWAAGGIPAFLPFIGAVLLAAWRGGFGPGLAATIFGAFAGALFARELPTFAATPSAVWVTLGIFLTQGFAIASVFEALHRTTRRIVAESADREAANRQLSDLIERSRRSEERLQQATEAISGLIYEIDFSAGTVWRSHALAGLIGVEPADAEPTLDWWLARCHPADAARLRAELNENLTGRRYSTHYRVRHAAGHYVDVWDQGIVFRDAAGKPFRAIGCTVDTTLQREAEEKTRRSEERFRLLADAMPQIVYVSGGDGRVEYLNSRWREYAGRDTATMEDMAALVPSDDLRDMAAKWRAAIAAGTPLVAEFRLKHAASGEYRWFLTRSMPVRDADGQVVNWFGTSTDIHDQKSAEAALREADRRKDDFLALLAHELRNPLAPVRNGLQVLNLTAPADDAMAETRAMMGRQLGQLVRLVDDLLDVSRISRGKLDLRLERVNMAAVVADAAEACRSLVEAKSHTLTLDPGPEPVFVEGDAARLTQVVSNLLNNSAKYTPPGGRIRVGVTADETAVRVTVTDSGIGIPQGMLPRIFDLFTQVDRTLDMSQGGLGIGLSLVRQLLDLHGGTVSARSDGYGLGSEFTVQLPRCAPPEPAAVVPAATAPSPARRRILVVDDNRDAADSLALMLQLMGHETHTGHDGLEAVALAAAHRPEVVLLDIGMPNLDGYGAARRIRELPGAADIVLVALTGWGQEEDRRKSAAAGFNRHLVKPVDLAALQDVLATLPRAG